MNLATTAHLKRRCAVVDMFQSTRKDNNYDERINDYDKSVNYYDKRINGYTSAEYV